MSKLQVDLILPCYRPHINWHHRVVECVSEIKKYLNDCGATMCLHVVDDGSGSGFFPAAELAALGTAVDSFFFHQYPENHGKGYSLRYGVAHCSGHFQIYTDYDFPFNPHSVIAVFDRLVAGADVVMGVRGKKYSKHLSCLRKWMNFGCKAFNRTVFGLDGKIQDTQAGLKGFNAAGRSAFLAAQVEEFMFDTEFILIANRRKLNIQCVPVALREDIHLSSMGWAVMGRELTNLAGIVFRQIICRRR